MIITQKQIHLAAQQDDQMTQILPKPSYSYTRKSNCNKDYAIQRTGHHISKEAEMLSKQNYSIQMLP